MLITRKPGYLLALDDAEAAAIDAHRFEELVRQARAARRTGELDRSVQLYLTAQRLWRGDPFADVPSTPAIAAATTYWSELRLTALQERFDAALAAGAGAELVAELTEMVTAHPLSERFVGQLILALYRSGRAATALTTYQQAKRRLADELGIDPSPELQQLEAAILRGEPLPTGSLPSRSAASQASSVDVAIPIPAQLPPDRSTFAGRTRELAELVGLCTDGRKYAPTVVVIDGMAGVGKTAFAVHAARQLAPRFPDGQLFLDLHGFTEDIDPVEPGDALDRMLRALGAPGDHIPHDIEARAATFRTMVANRRLLIVLDNAANEEQVQPLLPGNPHCLVLVTSRRRLVGLDDAHPISLDILAPPDADFLFRHVAGEHRIAAEDPQDVTTVTTMCGRLPLAIQIAATRLRARAGWTLPDLIERLSDHRHRLAEFEAGQRSVAAAFQLSYQHLEHTHQRMFRLLGLHPGADVDPFAAAALTGDRLHQTRRLLEDLVDAHLLQSSHAGSYHFHDLIRGYALDTAEKHEPEPDRRAALTRLFDYYAYVASLAADVLYPQDAYARPTVTRPSTPVPEIESPQQAATWFQRQLPNLLATAAYASEHGWPEHTVRMSRLLYSHLNAQSHLTEAKTLHALAARAAAACGDTDGEAITMSFLSHTSYQFGEYDQATKQLEVALTQYQRCGNRLGAARVLHNLGLIHHQLGQYAQALDYFNQAIPLRRQLGDEDGAARTLNALGVTQLMLGQYDEAVDNFGLALEIHRRTGDRADEAAVLDSLGNAERRIGRHAEAKRHLDRALLLCRETGEHSDEAHVLKSLGNLHRDMGRYAEALGYHHQALELYQRDERHRSVPEVLNDIGETLRCLGRWDEAMRQHEKALAIAEKLGDQYEQGRAHEGLGHAHRALARIDGARDHWRHALAIYRELRVPEAATVDAALVADEGNPVVRDAAIG